MTEIPIKIASGDYDRIQGVKTGETPIEGCRVEYLNFAPPETFRRLFDDQEFDVSEMSFSTYLMARMRGDWPYTAVPVFLSRVFPHCSIYIRTDRGIDKPEDLAGRIIGIPNFHFTRGLCVRGMLSDEYGLDLKSIQWRTGGIDTPGGLTYRQMPAPDGYDVQSVDQDSCLGNMLVNGEIDAIITYRDPQVYTDQAPEIGRLFPNFKDAEQDYFKKTGIFPIMHVVGIRDSLIDAHPWLAANVVAAFEKSKALCLPRLIDLDALNFTLPWLVAEAEETVALMGEDFWPYGLAKNENTLKTQIRWSHEQGIIDRLPGLEELFIDP